MRKKQLTDALRSLICKKYDDGKTPAQIAVDLDLNAKTITSVIRLYSTTGRVLAKKIRTPKVKLITQEGICLIESEIENDVSVTLNSLKSKLLTNLNINVSKSTIDKSIKKLNYSFKRVELIPQARNTDNNFQKRFDYCSIYLGFSDDNVIFLDEFGISCSSRQKYGRSAINTTPRKVVRAIRSKNISVIAALSKRRILSFKIKELAYNRLAFVSYVEELLEIMRQSGMVGTKIIMDNCSIHKGDEVKNLIESKGYELFFLPPYSPQLNPIEELFSKWKGLIKSQNPNTNEELYSAIDTTLNNITENDCSGYFHHVREYAVKGIRREEF